MAKTLLEEKNIAFEVREYLKESLTEQELSDLITQMDISAEDLLRKNEAVYKVHFKGAQKSKEEWVKAMIEYPKLMERPIVSNESKAVVARPAELLLEVLKQ